MNKKVVKCPSPSHKDRHASAAIFTRMDGSQWLHCLGCGISQLWKESEGDNMKSIEEWEESYNEIELVGTDLKQCLNEVELLEAFEAEKGISAKMISDMGGFVTDKGYLGFYYGKGREVYRNLLMNDSPRFINVGGNKGLMGDDILDSWDEVFRVEGLTDYISFRFDIGTNVVSSFGAELSEEQAYLLRGKTVFDLMDRDFAGFKGSERAGELLRKYGATHISIELPNGFELSTQGRKVDVNYLIHKEKESFKQWLRSRLNKYKTTDEDYLEIFKQRPPLKFYETDIPGIEFTEGLYIISGPPKAGKTTSGIMLTDCFAQQGGKVLYVNYDSTKDQIIARIASRYSEYSWKEIEANPLLITAERGLEDKVKQCLKNVKVMNKLKIGEIKHCKKYFTHMVIDYVQRVPNDNPDKVRGLELIMDEFSDMTSNDGMTIVGISRQSLSGNPYFGSSSIPYHADATMILTQTDEGIISCNIDNNRRGPSGVTLFRVDYEHQRLVPTKLNKIAEEKFKNLWEK